MRKGKYSKNLFSIFMYSQLKYAQRYVNNTLFLTEQISLALKVMIIKVNVLHETANIAKSVTNTNTILCG